MNNRLRRVKVRTVIPVLAGMTGSVGPGLGYGEGT